DEIVRKKQTEAFIKLWVTFWREVYNDAERSHAENVFKLVKLYIRLPSSSIESKRGFSCQNRIKTKSRALLSSPRLKNIMKLSLSFRHEGVDLSRSSMPLLDKAADV
ncbi:unnamed protein product, partial [Ectocarpus sp. 12 AP-2014]